MEVASKSKVRNFSFLLAAGCLALAGCGSDDVARVNGESISEEQFEAYLELKRINPADAGQRGEVLDKYLEREALAAMIEKQGVLDEAMIEAEINEFRKQMLISRYFDKYLQDKVGDDAVLNYYNTHADEFQSEKVHVAHVLLRTNRTMSEEERRAKLTAAQEIYSKIKAGEKFEDVAKSYSEDTVSGKDGGDLGWLARGSIDKRFSDKIFNMEKGELSEPFETNFGFHVVKLIDEPMVVKQPFDAVKGRIRHKLRTQAKEAELQRLVSEVDIEKKQPISREAAKNAK